MVTRMLRTLLVALALVFLVVPASAQSDADKATARNLFGEGQDLLKAKNCEGAADRFERAQDLYPAPTILLGLARAYKCLGKFVKSKEKYNSVIREKLGADASPAFKKAQEEARREIGALDANIGFVTITVAGSDNPKVTLDGEEVPVAALGVKRPVDPGSHTIKVTAKGFFPAEQQFTANAQQNTPVALTLQVDPNYQGDDDDDDDDDGGDGIGGTLQLVGFIALGVGAAGLILGGVTGGLAIGKHGDLEDNCNDQGQCPSAQQDTLDDFNTFGTISTVGFIAGGVVAAAGIALVVVGSLSSDSKEQARVEVGPTGITAKISF